MSWILFRSPWERTSYLPVKELNELRRRGLQELEELAADAYRRRTPSEAGVRRKKKISVRNRGRREDPANHGRSTRPVRPGNSSRSVKRNAVSRESTPITGRFVTV